MYTVFWPVAGAVILLAAMADAFWTTFTVRGAGWLSGAVAAVAGRAFMKGPRRLAENASLLALCASFAMWLLLLWAGWTLVFCGSAEAVVNSTDHSPATLNSRIYFAGFTLTTLGVGDVIPGAGAWRIATVLAATSGFIVLTLFVTYALSVITALNQRRALGLAVEHLGPSPEDVVALLRDGGQQALTTRLLSLTDEIEWMAVQADAFPVLEYSQSSNPQRAFARAIVALGEVALLLEHAIDQREGLPAAVWQPLRRAVDLMIREKQPGGASAHASPPPPPDVARLQRSGTMPGGRADAAFRDPEIQQMRSRWAAWLEWHGLPWTVVWESTHGGPVSRTTSASSG